MIKKYTLMALQKAINHALALDESMPDKLKSVEGKVLEVIITPLHVNFFIRFFEQKLLLLAAYKGEPDTIIHSSPLGLIRLSILPASKVRSLFNDKIRISGDIELGQRVKTLFDEIEIDWEDHLAHFTGDVVAHQIGNFVRQGITFKNRFTHSLRQNVTEYVHEEVHLFPTEEEVQDFFKDIDSLSLQTERLAAHVNQLLANHEID